MSAIITPSNMEPQMVMAALILVWCFVVGYVTR